MSDAAACPQCKGSGWLPNDANCILLGLHGCPNCQRGRENQERDNEQFRMVYDLVWNHSTTDPTQPNDMSTETDTPDTSGIKQPENYSFDAVNEFVHGEDVTFDDLQNALLGMAAAHEKERAAQWQDISTAPDNVSVLERRCRAMADGGEALAKIAEAIVRCVNRGHDVADVAITIEGDPRSVNTAIANLRAAIAQPLPLPPQP